MPTPEQMRRALAIYNGQPIMSTSDGAAYEDPSSDPELGMSLPPDMRMSAPPPVPTLSPEQQALDTVNLQSVPEDMRMSMEPAPPAAMLGQGQAPRQAPAPMPMPAARGGAPAAPHAKMLKEQQGYLGVAAVDSAQAENALRQGVKTEAGAMQRVGEAGAKTAAAQSGLTKQKAAEAARIGAEQQAIVDRRQAAADEAQRIARQYQAQADQIQVRDRRTTGQKLGGAIAIALGSMGASLQKMAGIDAQNDAQSIVDAMIERDLDEQMAMLENKKDAARAKWTEYGLAREQVGDAAQAREMALAALEKKYAMEAEAITQSGASEQATAQAQAVAQNLLNRAAQRTADNASRIMEQAEQRVFALQDKVTSEKAAAGKGKAGWGQFTVEQLQQLKAAGQLPADGEKYLADVLKGGAEAMSATNKATGKDGSNLSDGDKKLARLAAGVQPAVDYLTPYLQRGKDVPYFGVRKGTQWVPDAVMPEENLQFANSVDAVTNVLLRDESGASLPPAEIEAKRRSWGIDSGDPEVRKEGLRRMMREFAARRANGTDTGGVRFKAE